MDWDLDGKLDILSGCYISGEGFTGQLYLLRGKGGGDFLPPVTLTNKANVPVENVAVAESCKDIRLKLRNSCTHQHAVDYDDDGDIDLVVGSGMDEFYFHENVSATGKAPTLSTVPVALTPRLPPPVRHSAPHLADWDRDGDLDLISGSSAGGVFLSENSGTRARPQYEPFKILVAWRESSSPLLEQLHDKADFRLGGSTRVWTTDFNSDGWLDLLVGDSSEVLELRKGVTEAEFDAAMTALEEVAAREIDQMMAPSGDADNKQSDSGGLRSGLTPTEVRAEVDRCASRRSTGFVWAFIRKPPQ